MKVFIRMLIALVSVGWMVPMFIAAEFAYDFGQAVVDWIYERDRMSSHQFITLDLSRTFFHFGAAWLILAMLSWSAYLVFRGSVKSKLNDSNGA